MIKAIYHININCTDFERSLSFYEALGFKIVLDLGVSSPDLEHEQGWGVNIRQGKGRTRAALLRLGDSPGPLLDLIQWIDPKTKTPADPIPEYFYHVGPSRIALMTDDIHKNYDELMRKGINFLSKPVKLPTNNTVVTCLDPDGAVIELIEFGEGSEYYAIYAGGG
jgi:catechol 2,3-dioxygenase-like lactoylglutathione lyase family enzyme